MNSVPLGLFNGQRQFYFEFLEIQFVISNFGENGFELTLSAGKNVSACASKGFGVRSRTLRRSKKSFEPFREDVPDTSENT